MKTLVCVFLCMMLFSSCSSTFFLSTINTTSPVIDKNEKGDFVFENDSLLMTYSFNGEGAPIQITILNKTTKPLYVDWGSSAIVIGKDAYSYVGGTAGYNGRVSGDLYTLGNELGGSFYGKVRGNIDLPRNTSFLPPNTMISQKTIRLKRIDYSEIDQQRYNDFLMDDIDNEIVKVKRADFTPENTPLKFLSYITIYSDMGSPMVYQQNFFIENIIKTKSLSPKKMQPSLLHRGDMFYTQGSSKTKKTQLVQTTDGISKDVVEAAKVNQ